MTLPENIAYCKSIQEKEKCKDCQFFKDVNKETSRKDSGLKINKLF